MQTPPIEDDESFIETILDDDSLRFDTLDSTHVQRACEVLTLYSPDELHRLDIYNCIIDRAEDAWPILYALQTFNITNLHVEGGANHMPRFFELLMHSARCGLLRAFTLELNTPIESEASRHIAYAIRHAQFDYLDLNVFVPNPDMVRHFIDSLGARAVPMRFLHLYTQGYSVWTLEKLLSPLLHQCRQVQLSYAETVNPKSILKFPILLTNHAHDSVQPVVLTNFIIHSDRDLDFIRVHRLDDGTYQVTYSLNKNDYGTILEVLLDVQQVSARVRVRLVEHFDSRMEEDSYYGRLRRIFHLNVALRNVSFSIPGRADVDVDRELREAERYPTAA